MSVVRLGTEVEGFKAETSPLGPGEGLFASRLIHACHTALTGEAEASSSHALEAMHRFSWGTAARHAGIPLEELREHEVASVSGTQRSVDQFDWRQHRRACHLNSPTAVGSRSWTFFDHATRKAIRFERLAQETIKFVEDTEIMAGIPCSLMGNRFD